MNCSQARDEYKNSEILFTGKVVSTEVSIMSLYLISAPSNINQDIFKDKQRETENFSSSVDDTVTKGFGSRRSISLTENKRQVKFYFSVKLYPVFELERSVKRASYTLK